MEDLFSIKSYVYSFGVLMLEIVSCRRNNSFYNAAWGLWKDGAWLQLMDPVVGDSCTENQLIRCINVDLLCVEEDAADRPTMSDVISMLTNESTPLPVPTRPAVFTGRKEVEVMATVCFDLST
ncbi:hypothetical protein DVH24_021885 [Malus domestica]|uniref:Serine-threonine/tyrosine-protein kinase catalytic domain-containing protein n=1 Tax=Malus domestica TaxID=3750 RepID=A0A498IY44_MALDO|nr:hypothetical protein DVH24_021885 [Malus domestica]